jgi:hypothetical protein
MTVENFRACEIIENAPFQENVLTRQLNPLKLFPIPTYHERDAGPYITGGILIAKDPETAIRNAFIHRIRVFEMVKLSQWGARIMPACPGFYHLPQNLDELVDQFVFRVLDVLGLESPIQRWRESPSG